MASEKKQWDSSQLRKYDLNLEQIARLHYKDPKIDELIKENVNKLLNYLCKSIYILTLKFIVYISIPQFVLILATCSNHRFKCCKTCHRKMEFRVLGKKFGQCWTYCICLKKP